MSKLLGTWELFESENFDEYMKALGVGYLNRKAACSVTPTLVYINEGNEWTLKMQSILKNHDTVFTDGVEFEETTMDGRKTKTVIKKDGPDRLFQEQKDPVTGEVLTTVVREVVDDQLVQTFLVGNVKCIRRFKRK